MVGDLAGDPQVSANHYIVDVEHHALGRLKTLGLPIFCNGTGVEVRTVAPELGQHTEEILAELGHSWDEIVELRTKRVI